MVIDIEEFLSLEDTLTIDMRTEDEYLKSHIGKAINFEILTYDERKEISILYNDKRKKEAYLKAYEYALYKLPELFQIIKMNSKKNIIFYCARGGSRSSIVYDVFKNLKEIKIFKINGGYKKYRAFVNDFFKTKLKKFNFKSIDGYEGLDKEKILLDLSKKGYKTINLSEVIDDSFFRKNNGGKTTQKSFDNYIFENLFFTKEKNIYLEHINQKNINLKIREELLNCILDGERFFIKINIDERVENINNKYFSKSNEDFIKLLIERVNRLRKRLSNETADIIIEDLNKARYVEAIEKILKNYCDKITNKYNSYDKIIEYNSYEELIEKWSE